MQLSAPPAERPDAALGARSFALKERWSPEAQAALHEFLMASRTVPVCLSARALRRMDCLLLQYLLAAARAWGAKGLGFALADVSAPLAGMLARLGVRAGMLGDGA